MSTATQKLLSSFDPKRARDACIEMLASAGITVGGPEPWDVTINDERIWTRVLRDGTLGGGEAYVDGWWDSRALDQTIHRLQQIKAIDTLRENWTILPHIIKGYGGSNAQQPIILVQPKTQFHIFSATVSNVTIVIIVAALIFAILTDFAINRTKFGRGIRAVAQDSTTATLMGVSRERIIMTTFLIGGLLAGAAALLYTLKVPQGIIYSGGFLLGIKAFSAAVLGGIGNLRGALLGGLLLGIMENYGQAVFGTQWRDVVAFVLLVLVLLFRPTGILG